MCNRCQNIFIGLKKDLFGCFKLRKTWTRYWNRFERGRSHRNVNYSASITRCSLLRLNTYIKLLDNSKYQSFVKPPLSIPVSPLYTILKRVRSWPGVSRMTNATLSNTMWFRSNFTSNGVSFAEPQAPISHNKRNLFQKK